MKFFFFFFPKCKFCQSEMLHHFTTSSANPRPAYSQAELGSKSLLTEGVFGVGFVCLCF